MPSRAESRRALDIDFRHELCHELLAGNLLEPDLLSQRHFIDQIEEIRARILHQHVWRVELNNPTIKPPVSDLRRFIYVSCDERAALGLDPKPASKLKELCSAENETKIPSSIHHQNAIVVNYSMQPVSDCENL